MSIKDDEKRLTEIAEAFKKNDPEEYEGESIPQIVEQIRKLSEKFLELSYKTFVCEGES